MQFLTYARSPLVDGATKCRTCLMFIANTAIMGHLFLASALEILQHDASFVSAEVEHAQRRLSLAVTFTRLRASQMFAGIFANNSVVDVGKGILRLATDSFAPCK